MTLWETTSKGSVMSLYRYLEPSHFENIARFLNLPMTPTDSIPKLSIPTAGVSSYWSVTGWPRTRLCQIGGPQPIYVTKSVESIRDETGQTAIYLNSFPKLNHGSVRGNVDLLPSLNFANEKIEGQSVAVTYCWSQIAEKKPKWVENSVVFSAKGLVWLKLHKRKRCSSHLSRSDENLYMYQLNYLTHVVPKQDQSYFNFRSIIKRFHPGNRGSLWNVYCI